jgi:hypothetical protein
MRQLTQHLAIAVVTLFGTMFALADVEIRSPGFQPSKVAADGSLVEPWGAVRLQIIEPPAARVTDHRAEQAPMPVAVTCMEAGPVTLKQSAYRAPIWPSGVDVLEALLANTGQSPTKVQLEVAVPEEMELGEFIGTVKGQPSLALPAGLQPVREERAWGCTGGGAALPGWASPNVQCDPAFRNISAGMGGVPITYRFAVEPGAKRTVVLGFCESHHTSAGVRPVVALVEGEKNRSIDPVDAWGQHVPGVVRFDAADVNRDRRLEVTVAPHPRASDQNPILNVLWIFDPDVPIDNNKLIAGGLNNLAQRYVDVGGKKDQGLYKQGNLKYVIELGPEQQREFFFLVRSPGCRSVPDPSLGLWDKSSLRKAAADVWRDHWEETATEEKPREVK